MPALLLSSRGLVIGSTLPIAAFHVHLRLACAPASGSMSTVGPCSISSPSSMKMHSSLVRRAWAMLCVTMTIVYRPRKLSISRSMAAVPSASSAEQGSSIRMTRGLSGSSRAMHSFCCCSSVRCVALRCRPSLTSSHSATSRQRRLDQLVELTPRQLARAGVHPQAEHARSRRSKSAAGWAAGRPCRPSCAARRG